MCLCYNDYVEHLQLSWCWHLFVLLFAVFISWAGLGGLPPAVTVNTGMLGYLLQSSLQSNCSEALFTVNGCKPSPVFTFLSQLLNTNIRSPQGKEKEGCVSFKLLQEERLREGLLPPSPNLQDISPHGWPALTLVAYLSSIVPRSFQHEVYLNVCRRTGVVKQRLILPGLFKLIPSPPSHNLHKFDPNESGHFLKVTFYDNLN